MERWKALFPCLDQGEADILEAPFSKEESRRELMSVVGNKASGLHGFSFKFAQVLWPELREEIISMFENFFEIAEFDHRLSSFFITLIPKVESPASINDFRSISLMG